MYEERDVSHVKTLLSLVAIDYGQFPPLTPPQPDIHML